MFPRVILLLLLPCAALAQTDEVDPLASPWSGSGGELGFAAARGNGTSESLNGGLRLRYDSGGWIHSMDAFGLRSSARYTSEEGGVTRRVRQTTANRYSLAIGSALQLGEYRQMTTALRYERDDFAAFDHRIVVGVSYGTRLIRHERVVLEAQFGPGARRSHERGTDENHDELIARGIFDLKVGLTDSTELINTLLLESGSENTFAQNDLGISVAMNKSLALKAGWQARYNSDVDEGSRSTDTLLTMNVVYNFK